MGWQLLRSFLSKTNGNKASIASAYLGLTDVTDVNNPLAYRVSQSVNLLPLFTYQKIYYDFYSNNQWEKHLAYTYNVDYWDGKSPLVVSGDMLKLRYANYPKDYFMGVLPSSQYGSVAVFPSFYDSSHSSNNVIAY